MSGWGNIHERQAAAATREQYDQLNVYRASAGVPLLAAARNKEGQLYSGNNTGEVCVWDVLYGGEEPKQRFQLGQTPIRDMHALDDGTLIVAQGAQVLYVDGSTGQMRSVGERDGKTALVAALFVKHGLVYAAYTDGCVRVWHNGEWKGSYRGHSATVLCLEVVGREMFTGSADQTIMTWNLRDAKPHVIWRGKFAHNGPIRGLAVHRGTIWFADGARVLAQNIATGMRCFKCEGHEGSVKKIVLHAPSDRLYSTGDDRTVRVWSTDNGTQLAVFSGHSGAINSLTIDARGFLFTASSDQTIREWATATMQDQAAASQAAVLSRQSTVMQGAFPTFSRDSVVHATPPAARRELASSPLAAPASGEPPKPRKAAPRRRNTAATPVAATEYAGTTALLVISAMRIGDSPPPAATLTGAADAEQDRRSSGRRSSGRRTAGQGGAAAIAPRRRRPARNADGDMVPLDSLGGGAGGAADEAVDGGDAAWDEIDDLMGDMSDFNFDEF